MDHYKKTANAEKRAKEPEFTKKSEIETLKRNKTKKQPKSKKEEIPPSQTYLQSANKDHPIVIGKEV